MLNHWSENALVTINIKQKEGHHQEKRPDYLAAFPLGAAPMGRKDEAARNATMKCETDGKNH
jgi:hypothetical protein